MSVEWREPTITAAQRRTKWAEILTPLIANPSAWAVVQKMKDDKAAKQAVNRLRHADNLPDGKWEFVADNNEVFARYVGPQ